MDLFEQFSYTPLPNQHSIRLICLRGSQFENEDVQFTLNAVSLDACPRYEALSYTWGGQTADQPVWADGLLFLVTKNAATAMRRLRSDDANTSKYLWIDAICINQNDIVEKSSQVALMADIYGKAACVNIWLGNGNELTDLLFMWMHRISYATLPYTSVKQFFVRLGRRPNLKSWEYRISSLISYWGVCCFLAGLVLFGPIILATQHGAISQGTISKLKAGSEDIASRQYWKRVWTVQESALNPSCFVYCGSAAPMHLVVFKTAYQSIANLWHEGSNDISRKGVFGMHMLSINLMWGFDTSTLDQLITKEATLAIDKVYGIRALFPGTFGRIPVDYSQTTSHNFTTVARVMLLYTGYTNFLEYAGQNTQRGFPSWVPDWTRPAPFDRTWSGNATKHSFAIDLESTMPEVLRVRGLWIDVALGRLSGPFEQPTTNDARFAKDFSVDIQFLREALLMLHEALSSMVIPLGQTSLLDQFAALLATSSHESVELCLRWLNKSPFKLDYRSPSRPRSVSREHVKARQVLFAFHRLTYKKSLFISKNGRLGLSPAGEEGDQIVLLSGSSLPYLVRACNSTNGHYKVVAPCYLHGVMQGELWPLQRFAQDSDPKANDLDIIELV